MNRDGAILELKREDPLSFDSTISYLPNTAIFNQVLNNVGTPYKNFFDNIMCQTVCMIHAYIIYRRLYNMCIGKVILLFYL